MPPSPKVRKVPNDSATEATKEGIPAPPVVREALLFFLSVFLIYVASPIISSGDSHFVIPTALSIIRHGDANIDEYSRQFSEAPWAIWKDHGHAWNAYPSGVPFLVVPFVWAVDKIGSVFGMDLEASAIERSPMFLELILASLITAATAALLFYYFRGRLSVSRSLLLAGLFALGTSAYSSASRGLWQHGPSMLLLVGATLLYERLDNWKWRGAVLLGFCAGYSYAVRPANLIVSLGFAVLIALTKRRWLIPYSCGAVLGLLPLCVFNLATFGTWSTMYYRMLQGTIASASLPLGPLLGTLFSPSRGLFVFSPFLLFACVRFGGFYRRKYRLEPIEVLLIVFSLAWWIGTARWPFWWGGGSYGPRLLCDAAPCIVILLVPFVAKLSLSGDRKTTALSTLFVIAGALSMGIHLRGATSQTVHDWNNTPVSVDEAPQRVWSWEDMQFLRGFHGATRPASELRATALGSTVDSPLRAFSERITSPVANLKARSGEVITLPVRIMNPTEEPWASSGKYPVTLSYKWFDSGRMLDMEGQRTVLPGIVRPGQEVSLGVEIRIPKEGTDLTLKLSLVQEGVAWFLSRGGSSLDIPVKLN